MRKGLLAPQNTFLDTIAERFDGSRKSRISVRAKLCLKPRFGLVHNANRILTDISMFDFRNRKWPFEVVEKFSGTKIELFRLEFCVGKRSNARLLSNCILLYGFCELTGMTRCNLMRKQGVRKNRKFLFWIISWYFVELGALIILMFLTNLKNKS